MTSLHSARWYRVAGLKPRLSSQVTLSRQQQRGERWMLLSEAGSGRSVRLNASAYAIAGRLDGRRTMQELWDWQFAHETDAATQDEVMDLLTQLREAGLVQIDRAADFDVLLPHLDRMARSKRRNTLFSWRVPLADPSRVLDRMRALQLLLFSRSGFVVWALVVAMGLALALQHAPTLWAHGQQWMGTPRFAWLAALLYVPIKLLHELGHGLAVRRWGGQVREAGVTLMMLMPVPYVDASSATGFERRRHRMLVGAAGMMVETALAAIALPLWLWLDDGLLRDAAFVAFVVAGISTLLFNANPLQRLDGYYIVADAMELPNLATRSRSWWVDLLRRRLLRPTGAEPMLVARGEAPWLFAYAPLAWLYGVAIAGVTIVWLGQVSLVLGLACGALLGWQMVLRPVWQMASQLRRSALAQAGTRQRWRWLSLTAVAAITLALAVPMPQHTLVQGVVWPADEAQLRADEDGFVDAVLAHEGERLVAGQAVLQLANPGLQSSLERQRARVGALETELFQALPGDGATAGNAKAGDANAELAAARAELARLDERVAGLVVRAHADGRLALPQANDLAGQFVRRGRLLGQVRGDESASVRVALPESEASDLRGARRAVSVRLAGSPGDAHAAMLVRDGLGAVMRLPSAALSARHGGSVQTDPRDSDDLKPLQPVVLLDVRLDEAARGASERMGERAWVRFDAGLAPAAWQAAQAVRRLVLRRFHPQV